MPSRGLADYPYTRRTMNLWRVGVLAGAAVYAAAVGPLPPIGAWAAITVLLVYTCGIEIAIRSYKNGRREILVKGSRIQALVIGKRGTPYGVVIPCGPAFKVKARYFIDSREYEAESWIPGSIWGHVCVGEDIVIAVLPSAPRQWVIVSDAFRK